MAFGRAFLAMECPILLVNIRNQLSVILPHRSNQLRTVNSTLIRTSAIRTKRDLSNETGLFGEKWPQKTGLNLLITSAVKDNQSGQTDNSAQKVLQKSQMNQ